MLLRLRLQRHDEEHDGWKEQRTNVDGTKVPASTCGNNRQESTHQPAQENYPKDDGLHVPVTPNVRRGRRAKVREAAFGTSARCCG